MLSLYGKIYFFNNSRDGALNAVNSTIVILSETAVEVIGNGGYQAQFTLYNARIVLSPNSSINFLGNNASCSGGAISLQFSAIELLENSSMEFIYNFAGDSGGAIYLYFSALSLSTNTSISFTGNYAGKTGGAIFIFNSTINLSKNTIIDFSNNSAVVNGGAIYVVDLVPSLYCLAKDLADKYLDICFFQVPRDFSDAQMVFHNNHALSAGSDIYGGIVDNCMLMSQSLFLIISCKVTITHYQFPRFHIRCVIAKQTIL